jgi:hypothetical protein
MFVSRLGWVRQSEYSEASRDVAPKTPHLNAATWRDKAAVRGLRGHFGAARGEKWGTFPTIRL